MTKFSQPRTIEDGEIQRRQIVEEIASIAQQLAERKRMQAAKFVERHPHGTKSAADIFPEERIEKVAYETWRISALKAMRMKEAMLRQLNDWLKAERRKAHTQEREASSPYQLIEDAHALLLRLVEEDVEFDAEELRFIARLRKFLDDAGKKAA